uniref:Bestrophin homolog n=1 Tax=Alexandrium monilatum TaxID=311494 RepID=A0A7S4QVR4_9DINO
MRRSRAPSWWAWAAVAASCRCLAPAFQGAFTLVPRRRSLAPRIAPRAGMASPAGAWGRGTADINIAGGERYSSADWIDNMRNFHKSVILRRIRSHLVFQVVMTTVVTSLHQFGILMQTCTATPCTIAGVVVGLLLVFRTNSAYDRFWEARKIMGGMMNSCRNLAQMRLTSLASTPQLANEFGRCLEALPYVTAMHLTWGVPKAERRDHHLYRRVRAILGDELYEDMVQVRCPPSYLLHRMRLCVDARYGGQGQAVLYAPHLQLLDRINGLVDGIGALERILRTPVPMSYSRHLSRFLTIWLGTLPFVLVNELGWLTIPVVAAICWAYVGAEEIGHTIENPFNDLDGAQTFDTGLPMVALSTTISSEVRNHFDMYEDGSKEQQRQAVELPIKSARESADAAAVVSAPVAPAAPAAPVAPPREASVGRGRGGAARASSSLPLGRGGVPTREEVAEAKKQADLAVWAAKALVEKGAPQATAMQAKAAAKVRIYESLRIKAMMETPS